MTALKAEPLATPEQMIDRLCLLTNEVHDFLGYTTASDCFCRKGGLWDSPNYCGDRYRNDGVVLAWVERVVREAIAAGRDAGAAQGDQP